MVTVIRHTYRKNEGSSGSPIWREEADELVTSLEFTDQMDSVSATITGESQGLRTPTLRVETDIRMSYTDVEKIVVHLSAILAKHKVDIDKELAADNG